MKDADIFKMLSESTGIPWSKVIDFRPCSSLYVGEYGIPHITDAISIKLKENGTLIYIPDKDANGNPINRWTEKSVPRIKIVIEDGILQDVLANKKANEANIQIEIIDADSEYDSQEDTARECMEENMIKQGGNVTLRHPRKMHYYELCFYHDEDIEKADPEKSCSYCIKTEMEQISKEAALAILVGKEKNNPRIHDLKENCTAVREIEEWQAIEYFSTEEMTVRNENEKGIYYTIPIQKGETK